MIRRFLDGFYRFASIPVLSTLFFVIFLVGLIAAYNEITYLTKMYLNDYLIIALYFFAIILSLFVISILFIAIYNRVKKIKFKLFDLSVIYFEIILIFSLIYFYLVQLEISEIEGLQPLSKIVSNLEIREDAGFRYLTRLSTLIHLQSLIDTFYYSAISQTTVGYGDIYPKGTLAKIVSAAQSIVGFFLVVVGIGKIVKYEVKPPEPFQPFKPKRSIFSMPNKLTSRLVRMRK